MAQPLCSTQDCVHDRETVRLGGGQKSRETAASCGFLVGLLLIVYGPGMGILSAATRSFFPMTS